MAKSKLDAMMKIEQRLNAEIGFEWWKRYIAAAFWSNVSTPVNLTITLLTALTTTQTTTQNLLSHDTNVGMSVCVLVLTVLNTFFRPHYQMVENMREMKLWSDFGVSFEAIYYTENDTEEDFLRRFNSYKELQTKISQKSNIEKNNFLTDMIHMCAKKTILHKKDKWVAEDEA